MSSRASPYSASVRRRASKPDASESVDKNDDSSPASLVCRDIEEALQSHLSPQSCVANDVSIAYLQYRLLGAKRYWYRYLKQEKTGAKQWEARCFEVALRRSTLDKLRSVESWHAVERLPVDDVQLTSLGMFDSEKQAIQALDAAFKLRDTINPLRLGTSAAPHSSHSSERRSSRGRVREPLSPALTTRFHVVVVSDAFARQTQRQRLVLVYEILLQAFPTARILTDTQHHRLRGFSVVGDHVRALRMWRTLPFHLSVVAKTPTEWKLSSKSTVSDTERLGMSHLRPDRALGVDTTVLPLPRGLLDLVTKAPDTTTSKLPHFYHGLPDELKRMMTEEQDKANASLANTSLQKLGKNTEATFLPRYLKRRRELDVAATRLQRLVRRLAQRKILRYLFQREAAGLCLQRIVRGHQTRTFVAAYRTVVDSASTIIQAVYRSHASRESTKRLRVRMTHATLDLQRVYRGYVGRKYARWVRHKTKSAIAIERVVRGFMGRRRAARIRYSALKRTVLVPAAKTIQRIWRGFRARHIAATKRLVRHQLSVLNPAAVRIGRIVRGFLARQTAAHFRIAWHSARVIQKHWRSHKYYGKWMALMELRRRDRMASKIGALGRGYVARQFVKREKRRVYLQYVVIPAVVRIQRVFRGFVVRKQHEDFRDRVEAAITLQQMWRKRHRIQTIQSKLRGFREAIRHASATRLQYWYKCCKAKELFALLQSRQRAQFGRAAIVIQCAWRSFCSRAQLRDFRLCSRIERTAQALTKWKDEREDIEFDIRDARADLKRTIKYKAKSLRRIKELKEMRLEWERRQPVVDKELAELTPEDMDRGWGEAFETEKHILRFQLELSVEDILGRKDQIREYEAEIEDLRLELEDLERDLEECILDETMELETYRDMEVQQADRMFAAERAHNIRLQRVRWGVRNDRRKVLYRARDDLQAAERDVKAQRQVQELGVLGFEKKLQLQEKIEHAIERVVRDRAHDNQVLVAMRRDATVVASFDQAIQRMSKITNEYSFEYRLPKHDVRELVNSPMCDGCGRISCDCDSREETPAKHSTVPALRATTSSTKKLSRSFGTNYGHPLRRKRNYGEL